MTKRHQRIIPVIALALLLALFYLGDRWRPSWSRPPSPPPEFYPFETASAFFPVAHDDVANKTIEELCASFPHHLTQRIQPVLKMGHGENRDMIDAQFQSVSACFGADELLVFSDLDEVIHGRHAIDILANLPRAYRDNDAEGHENPDYANYEAMYALSREGKLTVDNDPARGKNGWRLDKYKFLAEVERAWLMRPGRDFYVFYETDTYISWDNMFRFLSMLDPQALFYIGSPSPGRHDEQKKVDTWFANGGPGFVLSRGAIEKLLGRRSSPIHGQFIDPPFSLRWLDLLRSDPCGDSILGWAMWTAGVPLSGFFPLFNPYPAHVLPYTDRMWCQPFLTMHKLRPEDMTGLWRWENANRKLGRPLLYSDLFVFLPVASEDVRSNWDNTLWDRLAPGHDTKADSLQACKQACEDSSVCMQYHWQGEQTQKCVLQAFMSLGVAKNPETVERKIPIAGGDQGKDGAGEGEEKFEIVKEDLSYTSGWLKARIDRWVEEHVCKTPDWVFPSIERHY
ncbi:glycosyltransferase family 31 protein [Canariomyces notabilis]|uniref:N-acetylgalactosaminide beta-1,3-galactosyltransferase n=1 Tax=Canariomyces notabilis TaxID=2074819 RepID=A0AAN6YT92_9PEZI|nr:glycosyltransferase family 31 protein [Canariomyces arenarius]